MTVIVTMTSGEKHRLDRRLYTEEVAQTINDARGTSKLVEFDNDATPSRKIWIDPDEVEAIKDDGYSY